MRYVCSGKTAAGVCYFVLPAVLILLLAAVLGGASATDALPDADAVKAAGYLAECGWTVDAASCETARVRIPAEFGAVYERYNALQRSQGFDLTPWRGCDARRYTFTVTDYPGYENTGLVRANVLFAGGEIIAADLCSAELNGFIRGVK